MTLPLRHRLTREPGLAAELRQSIVFFAVPSLIVGLAGWAWLRDPASVPGWFTYAGGPVAGLVLVALGWQVAARARRLWRGATPTVETSVLPVRPGQSFDLRITDDDATSVAAIEVYLVAEDIKVERVPLTTASSGGWRFTEVVRHQVPVLSVSRESLRLEGSRLDRVVRTEIPAEFGDRGWRWAVIVIGQAGRGMPRVDRYPLHVE